MNKFIFDLDGLLVDTQTPFHAVTEAAILKKYCNVVVRPEEISARFAGMPTVKVFEELAPGCDTELLREKKWTEIYRLAKERHLYCLPGMYETVAILWKTGYPIAIASASPPKWIETCLRSARQYDKKNMNGSFYRKRESRRLSLDEMFGKSVVSAESCARPKPAPDVFLKAQSILGNENGGKTFVAGDGRSDVLGGLAAGIDVLYLSPDNQEFDLNPRVRRFKTSLALSRFIVQKLS